MSARPKVDFAYVPMTQADTRAIATIESSLYEFPWSEGNFLDSIQSGYSCWTVRAADEIVGYGIVMVGAGEAHLLNISVALQWQGRGIGRALLGFCLSLARERKALRIFLEVRPSNAVARALYEDVGFTQIGVRKLYYPAALGREDALVLEYVL